MNIFRYLLRWLKWSGGFAIYHLPFFAGLRNQYLGRMYTMSERRGWLFRSFRGYVLGQVAYRQLPEFRTAILTGESGRRWAEFYRSQPEEYYLEGFSEPLKACEELLQSGAASRFLQIGCAGGRELAILASRFPYLKFCGVDINAAAIQENQKAYAATRNLEFRVADLTLSDSWTQWHPDVIYSSGCLEYLAEDEVAGFIRRAHEAGVSRLILCEPTDGSMREHSVPRGGAAFAHDYRHLAAQGGWSSVRVICEPAPDKNLLLIASRDGSTILPRSNG